MVAHLPRVDLQRPDPPGFVPRLLRVEERLERRLGVDDDVLAAGEVHDQIRPEPAVVANERRLLVEIAPLEHARDLDHAPELHLSPSATDGGGVKRTRECVRGRTERRNLL